MNPGVLPFRLQPGPGPTHPRPHAAAPKHGLTAGDEDSFSAVLGRALEVRGISLLALQRRLADRATGSARAR